MACISCSNISEEKKVRNCFEIYKNSILNDNYESATEILDSKSVAYYEEISTLVRTADSSRLHEEQIFTQLTVLIIRSLANKIEISKFNGKSLFTYSLQKGLIEKANIIDTKIDKVKISENFAIGSMVSASKEEKLTEDQIPKAEFYKEKGVWKFSLISLIKMVEPYFKEQLIELEVNSDEFIELAISEGTGKKFNPKLWNPN
jgi:fructose-specific phosphotransferase system component IIB